LFGAVEQVDAGWKWKDLDPFNKNSGIRKSFADLDRHVFQPIAHVVDELLVPPPVRLYMKYLEGQAHYRGLPPFVKLVLSDSYDFDLSDVSYAENVDTVHGQAITFGYNIYFPKAIEIDPAAPKRSDVEWLLHGKRKRIAATPPHHHCAACSPVLLFSSCADVLMF
jgi:hypothetical protein